MTDKLFAVVGDDARQAAAGRALARAGIQWQEARVLELWA